MCASQYTRVNSYHCTVQCTVYTVYLYRYGPVSTLMFTAVTALYNKRCTPKACTPMAPASASAKSGAPAGCSLSPAFHLTWQPLGSSGWP